MESTVVEHRLDTEGADLLLLSGVSDANIQELARRFRIRVVLRGDQVILSGELDAVERAVPLIQHLIELARLRDPFDTRDVSRLAEEFESRGLPAVLAIEQGIRIALPGSRKVITPKSGGQASYLELIRDRDIVISIGPDGST